MAWAAMETVSSFPLSQTDFGIFSVVAIVACASGAIPAAFVSHMIVLQPVKRRYQKCFAFGAMTGAFALLVLNLITHLDLGNHYVRENFLRNLFYLPFFGLAGGIGAIVFCFIRLRLPKGQWP